jgi:hypothetical protein
MFLQVWEDMKEAGVPVASIYTYNALISACEKGSDQWEDEDLRVLGF